MNKPARKSLKLTLAVVAVVAVTVLASALLFDLNVISVVLFQTLLTMMMVSVGLALAGRTAESDRDLSSHRVATTDASAHGISRVLPTGHELPLCEVLDQLFSFVAVLDDHGRVIWVNRAPLDAAGLRREDVLGAYFSDVYWFSHSRAVHQRIQTAIERARTGCGSRFDIEARAAEGLVMLIDFSLSPLPGEDGRVTHLVANATDVSERARAMSEMEAAKAQLETVIESIPAMVFMKAADDLRYERFNRTGEEMAGVSRDQLLGRNDADFFDTEHAREYAAHDRLALSRAGVTEIIEEPMRTASGEIKYLRTSKVALKDAAGKATHLLGISLDISELKAAREALEQNNSALEIQMSERNRALAASEKKFRTAMHYSRSGMVMTDLKGRFTESNVAFCKLIGYSHFELLRMSFQDITHADDRSSGEGRLEGVRKGRIHSYEVEKRYIHKNGRVIWVSVSCAVVPDGTSGPGYLIAQINDVTSNRQRERATSAISVELIALEGQTYLDTAARLLAEALATDFSFIVGPPDTDGRVRTLSRHGYGEVLPNTTYTMLDNACADVIAATTTHMVDRDLQQRYPHCRLYARHGFNAYAAVPMVDADGELIGHIGVLKRDVIIDAETTADILKSFSLATAVALQRDAHKADRLARVDAEQANDAKSAFLAAMSHEIRTPMNGVLGTADLLARSSLRPDQIELVDTIHESAQGLLTIIDDILDFSKIEAGRMDLESAPVSIEREAEFVLKSVNAVAVQKNVFLSAFIDPALPPMVLSDGIRLRQIMSNLLANAVKFSAGDGRRGRVHFTVGLRADAQLEISVADNGIGIDEQARRYLFQPFAQAESSTTRRFGGTGLGLTICRRLVDSFGGEIRYDSETGQGTTFTVCMPLQVSPVSTTLVVAAVPECRAVVVGAPASPRIIELTAYLEAAGAVVQICPELGAASRLLERAQAVPTVVICRDDPGRVQEWEASLSTRAEALVVIDGDPDAVAIVAAGRTQVIPGAGMTRRGFLRAVARSLGSEISGADPALVVDGVAASADGFAFGDSNAGTQHLLVADDNEVNRKVIARQLAMLGYNADIVEDGAAALAAWRARDYAMLLTDLNMPELDGYELARAIRSDQDKDGSTFPIVALTANAMKDEAERCRAHGMTDFLTKPTKLERLHEVIENCLRDVAGERNAQASIVIAGSPDGDPSESLRIETLHELIGTDPAMVWEFLREFELSARQCVAELRAAYASDDHAAVVFAAHKLKSSARSVGALALGELCAELESVARVGVDYAALIGAFNREFDCVMAAIAAYVPSAPTAAAG